MRIEDGQNETEMSQYFGHEKSISGEKTLKTSIQPNTKDPNDTILSIDNSPSPQVPKTATHQKRRSLMSILQDKKQANARYLQTVDYDSLGVGFKYANLISPLSQRAPDGSPEPIDVNGHGG